MNQKSKQIKRKKRRSLIVWCWSSELMRRLCKIKSFFFFKKKNQKKKKKKKIENKIKISFWIFAFHSFFCVSVGCVEFDKRDADVVIRAARKRKVAQSARRFARIGHIECNKCSFSIAHNIPMHKSSVGWSNESRWLPMIFFWRFFFCRFFVFVMLTKDRRRREWERRANWSRPETRPAHTWPLAGEKCLPTHEQHP